MNDNASTIRKNYILNLIYQILLIIIPVVTTPYLSRTLLVDGIGLYSYSYSLVTYFILIANFGYAYYAQREIVKIKGNKEKESKLFWEIIIIRFLTVAISAISYLLFSSFGEFESRMLMYVLIIDILAIGFDITFYFQGKEQFDKIITVNVIVKILNVVAIFIFVKSKNDLVNYALIQGFTVLFSNLFLWLFVIKKIGFVPFYRLEIFKHIKPAFYLFIPTIAVSIYRTLDKTLIGLITGSSAENGYYEQAEKIIRVALTVITSLGSVMISRNATLIRENQIEQVKSNIYNALKFVFLLALPMIAGTIIVSDIFAPWFLGEGYEPVPLLMKVQSLIFILVGLSNVLGLQYLVAYGKDKQYGISIILGAVINFILNMILIPNYGALGASIGTIVAEGVITLAMFIYARDVVSVKKLVKDNYKYLIATAFMLCLGIGMDYVFKDNIILMFVNIALCAGTYYVVLLILRDSFVLKLTHTVIDKIFKR